MPDIVCDRCKETCARVCEELRSSGENTDKWTITRDLAFHECTTAIRALQSQPSTLEQAWQQLRLVLPMAKAYAAQNAVGSNQQIVDGAQAMLDAAIREQKG